MARKKNVNSENLEPAEDNLELTPSTEEATEQQGALLLDEEAQQEGDGLPAISEEDAAPLTEQELDALLVAAPGDADASVSDLEANPPEAEESDPTFSYPLLADEGTTADIPSDQQEDLPEAEFGPMGAVMLPSSDEADTPLPQYSDEQNTSEPEPPTPVSPRRERALSIDQDMQLLTENEKEGFVWLELRNSLRSKRLLTGRVTGVERLPGGSIVAVVEYKGKRVIIPASEMYLDIAQYGGETEYNVTSREIQLVNNMMYAEIDFVVSGLDRRQNTIVGSRKEALRRKQRLYYFPNRGRERRISEGMVVEARVMAVGDFYVRVEVFGAECTVLAKEVAWEWVDDCHDYYQVGERVLVRLKTIDLSDPNFVRVVASIRETTPNPALENIKKCVVNGKYVGRITGIDERAIYVRLNIGVNAIAVATAERRTPCRRDEVSFVITRVDEETGIAIGLITRIIKQYL